MRAWFDRRKSSASHAARNTASPVSWVCSSVRLLSSEIVINSRANRHVHGVFSEDRLERKRSAVHGFCVHLPLPVTPSWISCPRALCNAFRKVLKHTSDLSSVGRRLCCSQIHGRTFFAAILPHLYPVQETEALAQSRRTGDVITYKTK